MHPVLLWGERREVLVVTWWFGSDRAPPLPHSHYDSTWLGLRTGEAPNFHYKVRVCLFHFHALSFKSCYQPETAS